MSGYILTFSSYKTKQHGTKIDVVGHSSLLCRGLFHFRLGRGMGRGEKKAQGAWGQGK